LTLAAVPEASRRIACDVVDVLDGFASLAKRSPTLDGSVPVRAVQACVPLLKGNAWGHQIVLHRRISLRKRLGSWSVVEIERGDELDRLMRATVPVLVADGTLAPNGEWRRRLERGVVDTRSGISVFTGLFVRPRDGVRIRQSATANRRSLAYSIEQAIVDDSSGLVPVVLNVVPAPGVNAFALDGEVATLGALPASVEIARATLGDAPHVGRAHCSFYDAAYFETKKRGAVTRRYRDVFARQSSAPADAVRARIVDAGPRSVEVARPQRVHRVTGVVRASVDPDRLTIANAISFTARFDGSHVTVTPDPDELAAYAREVRAVWERWFGTDPHRHPGALLYLTKYFTPHPPGEPNFFVKPASLLETSPGVSTLLDGVCGTGYDVLRGVVGTDGFHATPAVFQLAPGRSIEVTRGTPLVEMFPIPRDLIDADVARTTGGVRFR
jgi:hypothetical protein